MNPFRFEVIGMLLAPVVVFLGIVIAIVFYSKIAYLPLWMIIIFTAGFMTSCIIMFFAVRKTIKKINSKEN